MKILFTIYTIFFSFQSFSQICGYPDIVDVFSSNHPDYHTYTINSSTICNVSEAGCTREMVFQMLLSNISHAAPSSENTPIQKCGTYFIGILGTITIKIDEEQLMLTNYTRQNLFKEGIYHFLHPGKVQRKIIKDTTGNIFIQTIGEGTGNLGTFNESMSESVWCKVDSKLRFVCREKLANSKTYNIKVPTKSLEKYITNITTKQNDLVIITVKNTVSLGRFINVSGASGINLGVQTYNKPQFKNYKHGVLIASVGENLFPSVAEPLLQVLKKITSCYAEQGEGTVFLSENSGKLAFELNDNDVANNEGAFEVRVTIIPYETHKTKNLQVALKNYFKL